MSAVPEGAQLEEQMQQEVPEPPTPGPEYQVDGQDLGAKYVKDLKDVTAEEAVIIELNLIRRTLAQFVALYAQAPAQKIFTVKLSQAEVAAMQAQQFEQLRKLGMVPPPPQGGTRRGPH